MREYAQRNKEKIAARKAAKYLENAEFVKENARQYRVDNAKKISEARKIARNANSEAIKAAGLKWREKNREYARRATAEYRANNPDLVKKQRKEYYDRNKESVVSKSIEYAALNRDKVLSYHRARYAENKGIFFAKSAHRRARKLKATPDWQKELTEFVIDEAFCLARMRLFSTGIKWHVDHVVPLSGKSVCGLHVWNNFSVIPAVENLRKSNTFKQE